MEVARRTGDMSLKRGLLEGKGLSKARAEIRRKGVCGWRGMFALCWVPALICKIRTSAPCLRSETHTHTHPRNTFLFVFSR